MSLTNNPPQLIRSRGMAITAMCFCAYLAARRLWSLGATVHKPQLWFPLNSFLPNWLATLLNLTVYGMFAMVLIEALRDLRGPERLGLAILCAEILLTPLKLFVPAPIPTVILWLQAFGSIVMFLAAVQIFQRAPAADSAESEER